MFQEFLSQLGSVKNGEIPFHFRNQFKIKENFINPNSKHFDVIAQKLLSEEKAGIKRKWDKQCKMMFIWILGKFFQMKNKKTTNPNQEEWIQLAEILAIDENTLKQRWITLINPISKSINWDPEEDEIIRSLMNEQDEKHIWTHIALELYNQNNGQFVRTPKQVRERWMNYLNPKLRKTTWSQQEDLQLLHMVVKNGKRWSLISSLLEGRTENQVKNRFKSLIQKIYKDEEDDDIEELQAIKEYLVKQDEIQDQEPQKEEIQVRSTYQRQAKLRQMQKEPLNLVEEQPKKRKASSQIKDYLKISDLPQKQIQKVERKQIKKNIEDQIDEENDQQLKKEQNLVEEIEQKQQEFQLPVILNQQYQIPFSLNDPNKKELSTPNTNTLSYYFQSQMTQDDMKNDQLRLKQISMSPAQPSVYQGFRPYQEEIPLQIQQTPVQMLMGQYLKNYQQNYNMMSPFPQLNQTPMVYTPAQPMYMCNNNPYVGMSPLMIRSPFQENMSPSVQYQQPPQFWQPNQQFDQTDMKQQQSNSKLEFLKSNNLVDSWKRKRDNEKQSQANYDSLQQLDQ